MTTMLKVADNSKVRKVFCIKILGGAGKKIAKAGDIIVVSVIEAKPDSLYKKGSVQFALIVRTVLSTSRIDGSFVRFHENAVVMLNKHKEFVGSAVFGPIDRCIKDRYVNDKGLSRVVSCASEVL